MVGISFAIQDIIPITPFEIIVAFTAAQPIPAVTTKQCIVTAHAREFGEKSASEVVAAVKNVRKGRSYEIGPAIGAGSGTISGFG